MSVRCRQHGFTLIEIVAAFAILALGLALSMNIAGGAISQARRSASYTEAALYAKSMLDSIGIDSRLEAGSEDGEFDKHYRWRLEIAEFEPEDAAAGPLTGAGESPVDLYRLDLTVFWQEGAREQSARFATLRAIPPAMR